MHVFYHPAITEAVNWLPEEESWHAVKVLRLGRGSEIVIVDGKGGYYQARIEEPVPVRCVFSVSRIIKNFGLKSFRLHIGIAPTQQMDRFEWFLEKATEIGIDTITPLLCDHSERTKLRTDRLERILIAAMKQSVRAYLPALNPLQSFSEFLSSNCQGLRFIAHCGSGERSPLFKLLQPCSDILILIGPEGDFSEEEVKLALDKGFYPVSLGESRLRTETAGVVACHTVHLSQMSIRSQDQ